MQIKAAVKVAGTELSYGVNRLYTYKTVELSFGWIKQLFAFVEETIDTIKTNNRSSVFIVEVFSGLKIKEQLENKQKC